MNANPAANLIGITGIARRLVLDGILAEPDARRALDEATKNKKPVTTYLLEEKLATTGDTFRFRREAGRLRFFPQDAVVVMNDSRYNALSTFLYELGWSGFLPEDGHKLTAEGTKMCTTGDLPSTGLLDQAAPA